MLFSPAILTPAFAMVIVVVAAKLALDRHTMVVKTVAVCGPRVTTATVRSGMVRQPIQKKNTKLYRVYTTTTVSARLSPVSWRTCVDVVKQHTVMLKQDGSVWTTGNNCYGQ